MNSHSLRTLIHMFRQLFPSLHLHLPMRFRFRILHELKSRIMLQIFHIISMTQQPRLFSISFPFQILNFCDRRVLWLLDQIFVWDEFSARELRMLHVPHQILRIHLFHILLPSLLFQGRERTDWVLYFR